jgi:hypothetical protein
MEGAFPVIIIVAVVGLIIALAVLGHLAAKKRREELAALAASWGFRWSPSDPFGIPGRRGYSALDRGENRYAYNVFDGERKGRRVICFDYHYETHTHDSKGRRQTHHHRFSAALVGLGARFPYLLVRPEGFFDKVAEFAGFDDIDFESAEFSRKFYVKCEDRKLAYDVFHARAMEYMLAGAGGLALEFRGEEVLVTGGGTWKAPGFAGAVERIEGLLELVPAFVWEDLRGGARRGA